jgi:hypothetical protein
MSSWRSRLGLTCAEAGELLGYAEDQVRRIERRRPVKRDGRRQRQLVKERAPEAAGDRSHWLHDWRLRLGLSWAEGARRLGYWPYSFWRAANGRFAPSSEKVLVAIAEERFASASKGEGSA